MDTVTGLAVVGNKLVSGSKDKNLRLWNLDHSISNLKNTTNAFNDYVTTLQSIFEFMKAIIHYQYSIQHRRMDK